MESTTRSPDRSTPCEPPQKSSITCMFSAILGLQFLTDAAFGFLSPIISIVITEYFARLRQGGVAIDCGVNPHDEACIEGSQQAAWVSSLFSALGCVLNFILAPMLGQASDVYGRKPFLVLSQLVRVGTPFSIMYFMQPGGSITPYLILRLIDYGFGTAGVMSAAITDVITPEDRAAAFGVLFASLSLGYCISAFIAPFFSRDHVLQIAAALFVSRVLWAMIILPETLPMQARMKKAQWVMESPISAMSILFRNKLFLRLTCLIALTSFVSSGTFQIQSFYLNTIVGFDVKDFGNLMLLGGVLTLLGQGLLLKPLVNCYKEKGVIVIATIASFVTNVGLTGTAFYPHKWVVYVLCVPGSISNLSFPAIAALKSINASEKEQGRLQGAIYGARSVFDALGPVIFSSLYAAMTRQSLSSQALPYFVATFIYFIGIGMALSLPAGKPSSSRNLIAAPALFPSQTCRDSPSSSSIYFDTDDDETGEGEVHASGTIYDDDENYLVEPLLRNKSSTTERVHDDV